jgi:hypothetical protein
MVKDMETVDTQNKLESMVKDGQIHKATEDIKTEQNDNESTMISHTAQSDDVHFTDKFSKESDLLNCSPCFGKNSQDLTMM